MKQKKSKSIDMRFHWLRDRIRQGQFTITHLAGTLNLANLFTKTLPCAQHQPSCHASCTHHHLHRRHMPTDTGTSPLDGAVFASLSHRGRIERVC
jgi:hypothetical protein